MVNKDGRAVQISDYSYDIPLLQTIQQLLACETVAYHVFNHHRAEGGILGDFCDGELFRTNQLFCGHPDALQLHLYYDEVS